MLVKVGLSAARVRAYVLFTASQFRPTNLTDRWQATCDNATLTDHYVGPLQRRK